MNNPGRKFLAFPYIVWMILTTVIPLGLIFWYGLSDVGGGFTLVNVASILQPDHLKAMLLSILLSLISTALCLLLAFPLALVLRGKGVGRGSFVVFIFILPMWMNFLLRTLAWQTLLEKNGVINSILSGMHLPPLGIINTPYAIILGMVYNFLPFMILPIYSVLTKMDRSLLEAAGDLGADAWTSFRRVTFPLSLPGVYAGMLMVFMPAVTTFVISRLLGGGQYMLIGNVIEQQFLVIGNWSFGSAVSVLMLALILLSMVFLSRYNKEGGGGMLP